MQYKLLTSTAILILGVALSAAQTTQTFTGTVSDAMCGAHHMMKDATSAKCTRACVKQGSDFAIVSDGKVYILKGYKAQIDKFAGEKVVVKGAMSKSTIVVNSIATSK